jgi:uncharacterized protein YegP (UPF0339 family)
MPAKTPPRLATLAIYQDAKGEYRWRFIANGNIMADSAEGYSRRRAAWRAWERFVLYAKSQKFHAIDLAKIPTS